MIDANVTKLVHDHCGVRKIRHLQPSIQQCRLAASQKASQHYYGNAIVDHLKLPIIVLPGNLNRSNATVRKVLRKVD